MYISYLIKNHTFIQRDIIFLQKKPILSSYPCGLFLPPFLFPPFLLAPRLSSIVAKVCSFFSSGISCFYGIGSSSRVGNASNSFFICFLVLVGLLWNLRFSSAIFSSRAPWAIYSAYLACSFSSCAFLRSFSVNIYYFFTTTGWAAVWGRRPFFCFSVITYIFPCPPNAWDDSSILVALCCVCYFGALG